MNKEKNFVGFDCDDDGLNTAVANGGQQSFHHEGHGTTGLATGYEHEGFG